MCHFYKSAPPCCSHTSFSFSFTWLLRCHDYFSVFWPFVFCLVVQKSVLQSSFNAFIFCCLDNLFPQFYRLCPPIARGKPSYFCPFLVWHFRPHSPQPYNRCQFAYCTYCHPTKCDWKFACVWSKLSFPKTVYSFRASVCSSRSFPIRFPLLPPPRIGPCFVSGTSFGTRTPRGLHYLIFLGNHKQDRILTNTLQHKRNVWTIERSSFHFPKLVER